MAGKSKKNSTKKPMRRKAKATKADSVEVRTAGFGDNSQLALPAPEDYEHHMKSIRGAQDKAATAGSLVRHAMDAANKTCPGLGASIKETLKIEREGDPIKLQKRLELLGIGLKQIGSTIQLTIFDSLAGDVADQAYKRGHDDGANGRSANGRYPEGSDLANAYSKGWQEGMSGNVTMDDEQRQELAAAE